MNNTFCFNRDALKELSPRLTRTMRGACLSLMHHLCIYAQHSPGFYQGVPIERGQLFTGRKALSGDTGLSEKTIRNAISQLVRLGEILEKGSSHGTLLTIVNYDTYDGIIEKRANEGPTRGQRGATYKEEKGIKKEEEKTESLPAITRKRDPYIDNALTLFSTCWPTFQAPPVSLFTLWRKRFAGKLSEEQILEVIGEVGCRGATFPDLKNLTAYLYGALKGALEPKVNGHPVSTDPWDHPEVITHPSSKRHP